MHPPDARRAGYSMKDKHENRESALIRAIRGQFWKDELGQDIAEYAVMLAVILVIVIGTVKLIGSNANSTFSNVANSLQ